MQIDKVARYDRKEGEYVEVPQPRIIKEYNRHMGGVDLMDGLMGRYHIKAKTTNMFTLLFYHLIDMALTNAYILKNRIRFEMENDPTIDKSTVPPKIKLPDFRTMVAEGLVAWNSQTKRGRPTVNSNEGRSSPAGSGRDSPANGASSLLPKLQIGKRAEHPCDEIRYDNLDHMITWLPADVSKRWCKYCTKSQTKAYCPKCNNISLCCTTTKNCFMDYHTKK